MPDYSEAFGNRYWIPPGTADVISTEGYPSFEVYGD